MRKLIICSIMILLFSSNELSAKECDSTKGIFYVFLLQYNLENGRPVSSYFLCKDLNEIASLHLINTQKEILCWFYANTFLYQTPPIGISEFDKCHSFSKLEKQNHFRSLYKKLGKIDQSYCSVRSRQYPDVKNTIVFNCIKLSGDFWIPRNETIISDQVYSDLCPHKFQEYDLKEIFQFWKLTKEEEQIIKKSVQ